MTVKLNQEAKALLKMLGGMTEQYEDSMSETAQVMAGNSSHGTDANAIFIQHLNLNYASQSRYEDLEGSTKKQKKSNKILKESGEGEKELRRNVSTRFRRGISTVTAKFSKAFYMKDHNEGSGGQKERRFFALDKKEAKLMGKIFENMLVLFINKKGVKAK
jgi:homoserine trans-succinylase